jgi:hypothetical protein
VQFGEVFHNKLSTLIKERVYAIIYWNGDIAQLGERCVRIAEVGGSNPPISTTFCACNISHRY